MRSPLFILVGTFVVAMVVFQIGMGKRPVRSDADRTIDSMQALLVRNPEVGRAIAEADRGEPAHLLEWLNAAPTLERIRLAELLASCVSADRGLTDEQAKHLSIDSYYPYRHRLAVYVNISTGHQGKDAVLDNFIAYICSAGTAHPTADDLAIAGALLPRITALADKEHDHRVWDTVGCVHAVRGEWKLAHDAFVKSNELAEKVAKSSDKDAVAEAQMTLPLYRQRLAVAATNREHPTGDKQPLPLETSIALVPNPPNPTSSDAKPEKSP